MMTEKRYFEKRWEEEYYIFDSNTISESDFEEKLKYQDYKAFKDSMMGYEVVNRLNELNDENKDLKISLKAFDEELSLANRDCDILEEKNDQLKFENNELKCALALDAVDYIIADGKKIDIPPYYEFEQRYDHVMHRREYDGYD